MEEYEVDAPVGEVVRWVHEDAKRKTPRFLIHASKTYQRESDFDREAFGIGEYEDVDLVSVHGILEIQSRAGKKNWALQLKVDEVVGVLPSSDEENAYENQDDMSLAAFEEQFLSKELGEVEVTVAVESSEAKAHFNHWLSRQMRAH